MSKISSKRPIIFTAVVVVFLVAGGMYWWHHEHALQDVAQTTSKEPTAQNDYSGGDKRGSNNAGSVAQGGATDNKGDKSAAPGETGVTSASGAITVFSPAPNGTLNSGDTISGRTTGITQVQYRVIDDKVGVLAQGALQVVGGTYSGTLRFTPHSTAGRVDVYNYNSQGQEVNEVQIPVVLKG